jgi:hypothetical protein
MAYRKLLPSQAYLQECFAYDPATGEVRWKVRPRHHFKTGQSQARANTLFAGTVAGCVHKVRSSRLVREVGVDGKFYYLSRIIVKLMTGVDADEVDHIDGNPLNNVWSNLRPCAQIKNAKNRKLNVTNTSGYKGVTFNRKLGRHVARIQHDGKRLFLGVFDTPEEASAAYQEAAFALHGEFSRGS